MELDWHWQIYFWLWWILALGVILADSFITGDIFLTWFSPPAFILGAVVYFFHGIGITSQILLFSVLSIISAVVIEMQLKRTMPTGNQPQLNDRLGDLVGRFSVLRKPIQNGYGEARFGDCNWQIKGQDCPAGSLIKVIGVEGLWLMVEVVELPPPPNSAK